jgi:hypothetical protein
VFDAIFEDSGKNEDGSGNYEKTTSPEEHLRELLSEDSTLVVQKLFHKLSSEGFNVSKKQIRALKRTILEANDEPKQQSNVATSDSQSGDQNIINCFQAKIFWTCTIKVKWLFNKAITKKQRRSLTRQLV